VRKKTTRVMMPTRMSAVPNLEIMNASELPRTNSSFQGTPISE
jgi:hypothetical protein